MASPQNVEMVSTLGIWFLTGAGIELVTGVALDRSGLVRLDTQPKQFKIVVAAHLFMGVFCYGGQFFVQTH